MPKTIWKLGMKAELETRGAGHKKRIMKTSKIKFSLLKYFNKMSLIIHAFGGKLPLHSG